MRALSTVFLLLAACAAHAAGGGLADLIQRGDRDAALAMIRAGGDVRVAQGDGTTALHWAVYGLDEELVGELLERGADPNVSNLYGSSPLAEAVKVAEAGLVAKLLAAGADVEAPNEDGQTALMLAARTGSVEVAQLLVEYGADVNKRERWRGQTALMWAADERHAEFARFLIAHGADVEVRAKANDWPTQITSEPRAQYRPTGGYTALLYAARSGCTGCVEALLDAGADIDRPNPDGVTPLIIAIDNVAFDTAKVLLERGANPHTWDWWGRTPLYVAVDMNSYARRRPIERERIESSPVSGTEIIRMLLEAGVNPNAQLNMHRPGRGGNLSRFSDDLLTTGATPLLRAAIGQDTEAVRLLLEHGALVDLPNVMGVTPLMGAAGIGISTFGQRHELGDETQARVIETLALLVAAGADLNARVTDIESRTARIARPSSMTGRLGQTALYGAVRWEWAQVVEYLVAQGADVDVVDTLGHSPLDAALGRTGARDNVASEEVAAILRKASRRGG